MSEITLLEMLTAGVHFGHQQGRWHPAMKPYIHSVRNGIHVIDLEKTREKLLEALTFIEEVVAKSGTILFVGTKRQAQEIVKKYAQETGMPYVSNRWIGGTLTNFSVVTQLVKKLKKLKGEETSGALKKFTKKEQLDIRKEIDRLEELVGGMEGLEAAPQALYVIDIKEEKTAVREARRKKIPIVAICDSNANPNLVTHPIPANDDATKSIDFITRLIAERIKEGKQKQGAVQKEKKQ